MGEIAKLTINTPETKRENSVFRAQKTSFSQSINSPLDHILHLQRTIGNQAVQRLVKKSGVISQESGVRIQAKLKIGQPNDIYEQEADRVADYVMRMPDVNLKPTWPFSKGPSCGEEAIQSKPPVSENTPLVQRQPVEEEEEEPIQSKLLSSEQPMVQKQGEIEEEEEPIMAKRNSGSALQARADLHMRLNRSGGQPLPVTDRSFMERRFGVDFSGVRVHTDSTAIQMSRELNAQAFTHGRDVYFGAGRYSPGTSSGKRLLAHELTHVVQQGSSRRVGNIQRQKEIPEWKKKEKRFKQIVLDLKGKKPKSNMEKFNLGLNKLLVTLGHPKTPLFLLPKLRVTPKGRLLWFFVTKTGTALWLMKQGKLPNVIPSIKLRRNLLLDVETGGTFKKPKLMLKLKWTF